MKSPQVCEPVSAGMLIGAQSAPGNGQPQDEMPPACALCHGSTSGESEDERLVRACLAGDQAAWETLIDKYKRLIYSIPFRYGAAPEDAADIFQAVCIEVFNSLPQLKNAESLRSWL